MKDPIENIVWRDAVDLTANWWNPNRVFKQEFKLLEHSLLSTGWLQPILISPSDTIIDGFHRWRLTQDSKKVNARWGGRLPCATLELDEPEAMAMTVRINRAKGSHSALDLSVLVTKLREEHNRPMEWVTKELGMTEEEVELLSSGDIFKARKINQWVYSKAWYPVAPTS